MSIVESLASGFRVFLPLALAFIMFCVGLRVRWRDFSQVLARPETFILGLLLQWSLPVLLAWALVWGLSLDAMVAMGLVLVAVCPGGGSSNYLSSLAHGQVGLSIALTAVVSLLAPLSIPVVFGLSLNVLSLGEHSVALPFAKTAIQLFMVSLLPVLLAFAVRALAPSWSARWKARVDRMALGLFLAVVVGFSLLNAPHLPPVWSAASGASLLLCVLCLSVVALVCRLLGLSRASQSTLMIEVGIQNAGMAMMIAYALLQQPMVAGVVLYYGILMNIPALALIVWARRDAVN